MITLRALLARHEIGATRALKVLRAFVLWQRLLVRSPCRNVLCFAVILFECSFNLISPLRQGLRQKTDKIQNEVCRLIRISVQIFANHSPGAAQ